MVATLSATQQPLFRHPGAANYASRFGVNLQFGTKVAIGPYNASAYAVWSQLKRGVWARMRYDVTDATLTVSRRTVSVIPTMALIRAKDMSQTGAWNAFANTSTTGSNGRSVGNTSIATATNGRKISTTITPLDTLPYDVYVAFTQRTAGGFCKPTIDGAQTLLSSNVVDPQSLGTKAFSCYGTVDNTRRNLVKIASGLTGVHTVELEAINGVPTGSSATTIGTTTIEAVLYTSELTDPLTRATRWAQGQTIAAGDEREYGGNFYCCTVAGTTGATPPTHTSSTASDGGVTWSAAGTVYFSGWVDVRDMDYASEVEGAVVSLVYSGNTYDVGGQTHGNEFTTGLTATLDGQAFTLAASSTLTFGSTVEFRENFAWKTAVAGTTFATGVRLTRVTPGQVYNEKIITATDAFTIASAYGGMLPFVRWDGLWRANLFTQLMKPDGTTYNLDDFPTNVTQSLGAAYSAGLKGDFGVAGTVVYSISVDPESVNNYAQSGSEAQCLMNINAIAVPPSGGTDWQAKLYFARDVTSPTESIANGQVIKFKNTHNIGAG